MFCAECLGVCSREEREDTNRLRARLDNSQPECYIQANLGLGRFPDLLIRARIITMIGNRFVIPLFLVVLLSSLLGCVCCQSARPRIEYVNIAKQEQLAVLRVDSREHTVETRFSLPANTLCPFLVFVVHGVPVEEESQRLSLANTMLGLRLGLHLYEDGATNDFYSVELCPSNNMCGLGYWYYPDGCYIAQIEPFPYNPTPSKPLSGGVYRFNRDVCPVQNGRLLPGRTYRLRLTVARTRADDKRCASMDTI